MTKKHNGRLLKNSLSNRVIACKNDCLLFCGGFKPPLVVFCAFSFFRISMIVILLYCIHCGHSSFHGDDYL